MATPPQARAILFPIYAFNVEVARAPWVTEEPMIAEMRLQWWLDALEEIGQGGTVRKHEVVTSLADIITPEIVKTLTRLVQSRRWDIYREPFEDDEHFREYLEATSAGLLLSATRALGLDQDESSLRDIGYASGLANWFVAIPALESKGRMPLLDGRSDAIAKLAQNALDGLGTATKHLKGNNPALNSTWRAKAILRKVIRSPSRVADDMLQQSEFARKGSLLWYSMRNR